jgi:DNA-binding response OmpR family regulator
VVADLALWRVEHRARLVVGHCGEDGDEMASVNDYDVILLNWLLPDKDGVVVCQELRARGISIPILMLTARDGLEDRVTGLNSGADDYLTKPFGFSELLARIRALLRRSNVTRPIVLGVADLAVDTASHSVTRGGAVINLTPTEYAILEVLMHYAGAIVTRPQLIERVWATDADTPSHLLDVDVGHLRRKIDGGGALPLIHTIRGHGYRAPAVANDAARVNYASRRGGVSLLDAQRSYCVPTWTARSQADGLRP